MEYQSTNAGYGYVVRLEKGEQVIASLAKLAQKENITGGFFYGLGAVCNVTVGRFDVFKKEYAFQEHSDVLELASLNGSISLRDEKPFVHAHAVLADENLQSISGHVKEMEVAVTCEIFIHLEHGTTMVRESDDEVGIDLLRFAQ